METCNNQENLTLDKISINEEDNDNLDEGEIVSDEEQLNALSPDIRNNIDPEEIGADQENHEEKDLEEGELEEDGMGEMEKGNGHPKGTTGHKGARGVHSRVLCKFFSRGNCSWGSNCRFMHSDQLACSSSVEVHPATTPQICPLMSVCTDMSPLVNMESAVPHLSLLSKAGAAKLALEDSIHKPISILKSLSNGEGMGGSYDRHNGDDILSEGLNNVHAIPRHFLGQDGDVVAKVDVASNVPESAWERGLRQAKELMKRSAVIKKDRAPPLSPDPPTKPWDPEDNVPPLGSENLTVTVLQEGVDRRYPPPQSEGAAKRFYPPPSGRPAPYEDRPPYYWREGFEHEREGKRYYEPEDGRQYYAPPAPIHAPYGGGERRYPQPPPHYYDRPRMFPPPEADPYYYETRPPPHPPRHLDRGPEDYRYAGARPRPRPVYGGPEGAATAPPYESWPPGGGVDNYYYAPRHHYYDRDPYYPSYPQTSARPPPENRDRITEYRYPAADYPKAFDRVPRAYKRFPPIAPPSPRKSPAAHPRGDVEFAVPRKRMSSHDDVSSVGSLERAPASPPKYRPAQAEPYPTGGYYGRAEPEWHDPWARKLRRETPTPTSAPTGAARWRQGYSSERDLLSGPKPYGTTSRAYPEGGPKRNNAERAQHAPPIGSKRPPTDASPANSARDPYQDGTAKRLRSRSNKSTSASSTSSSGVERSADRGNRASSRSSSNSSSTSSASATDRRPKTDAPTVVPKATKRPGNVLLNTASSAVLVKRKAQTGDRFEALLLGVDVSSGEEAALLADDDLEPKMPFLAVARKNERERVAVQPAPKFERSSSFSSISSFSSNAGGESISDVTSCPSPRPHPQPRGPVAPTVVGSGGNIVVKVANPPPPSSSTTTTTLRTSTQAQQIKMTLVNKSKTVVKPLAENVNKEAFSPLSSDESEIAEADVTAPAKVDYLAQSLARKPIAAERYDRLSTVYPLFNVTPTPGNKLAGVAQPPKRKFASFGFDYRVNLRFVRMRQEIGLVRSIFLLRTIGEGQRSWLVVGSGDMVLVFREGGERRIALLRFCKSQDRRQPLGHDAWPIAALNDVEILVLPLPAWCFALKELTLPRLIPFLELHPYLAQTHGGPKGAHGGGGDQVSTGPGSCTNTTSRREQLLKQLRAVEEAIARKRTK